MAWTRIGLGLTGIVAATCALAATWMVWILLASPATVVAAVDQRSITPVVRELASALVRTIRELLSYL